MQGLRTQEGEKFERFFALVQAAAKKRQCVFFLNCGEGRELTTETMEGEDLFGWLIPESLANAFEKRFLDNSPSEDRDDFLCFAIWERSAMGIEISFQRYDIKG